MESDWEIFQGWLDSTFAPAYARTWWKEVGRHHHDPNFAKEIDKTIEKIENNPRSDYWVNYNMEKADEQEG